MAVSLKNTLKKLSFLIFFPPIEMHLDNDLKGTVVNQTCSSQNGRLFKNHVTFTYKQNGKELYVPQNTLNLTLFLLGGSQFDPPPLYFFT